MKIANQSDGIVSVKKAKKQHHGGRNRKSYQRKAKRSVTK